MADITAKTLMGMAYFYSNTDRQTLERSGIVTSDNGWERFNHNFDVFILKLPDTKRVALAELINEYIAATGFADTLPRAVLDVIAERSRQVDEEGWTAEHDDTHQYGELALAAAAYATKSSERGQQGDVFVSRIGNMRRAGWFSIPPLLWPFSADWFKPKGRREDLVKAGALIIAEIERLDRVAKASPTQTEEG